MPGQDETSKMTVSGGVWSINEREIFYFMTVSFIGSPSETHTGGDGTSREIGDTNYMETSNTNTL